MRNLKLNFKIIIIFSILFFLVMYIGNIAYFTVTVDKPLKNFLEEQNWIYDYRIENKYNNYQVDLVISNDIKNLNDKYKILNEQFEKIFGKRYYELSLSGKSNDNIKDFYNSISLSLHQNLRNGKYTKIDDEFKKISQKYSIDNYKLIIDNHLLFVQIYDGEYSFFKILPLESRNQKDKEET